MSTRPLVIAHRTCPLDAADNSIAGVVLAATLGADAVELDVRLTRDGVPVLMHDPTAWRTTRRPLPVRLTRADVLTRQRLRANGEAVPTLAGVLAALPAGLRLAVDVKAPHAMRAAVGVLQAAGHLGDAMLWCRAPAYVRLAHELAPGVPTALLRNTDDEAATIRYLDDTAALGATAVSLHERAVSERVVAAAHERRLTAYAWALSEASHGPLLDAGVDGLVTDWPRSARERVERDG